MRPVWGERASEAVPRRRPRFLSESLLLIERWPRVTPSRLQGRGTSRVHTTQAAGRGLRERRCINQIVATPARCDAGSMACPGGSLTARFGQRGRVIAEKGLTG